MVPLKPLSDQKCGRYFRFLTQKVSNPFVSFAEKPEIQISKQKQGVLIHTLLIKSFKVTVVNRTLPSLYEGLLDVTLTVSLTTVMNPGVTFIQNRN